MPDPTKFQLSPAISIIIAGIIVAGAILYIHANPNTAAQAADTTNGGTLPGSVNIPAPSAQDHIIGSPEAPIVLVEYSDFQCPFCSLVYPTLKKIVAESQGQVAWVMRNFPLDSIHPNARPAALAAECIAEQLGNDGWWKFTDALFTDQNNLGDARYMALALQFGANMQKYSSCVSTQKYATKLDDQSAEAAINGGVGTPYTIIYGHGVQVPLSGAQPYAQFAAVIRAVQARQ